jgi:hypothetical protein
VKTYIVSLTGSLEHTSERQTDDTVDNEGLTDMLQNVSQGYDDALGLSPENPHTPPHQITSAEDHLPKTPPGSHSINKVLKRKEHDFWITPERVKHHLAIQKIEQKIHSIENGIAYFYYSYCKIG